VWHSVIKCFSILMNAELTLLLLFLFFGTLLGVYLYYNWKPFQTSCKSDPKVARWTKDCKPATCVDKSLLPKDGCVKYRHCDQQFGPDYTTFDMDPNNERIKTFTRTQCENPCDKEDASCLFPQGSLCWDTDLNRCFNVRAR
jgi:hypothetical protein